MTAAPATNFSEAHFNERGVKWGQADRAGGATTPLMCFASKTKASQGGPRSGQPAGKENGSIRDQQHKGGGLVSLKGKPKGRHSEGQALLALPPNQSPTAFLLLCRRAPRPPRSPCKTSPRCRPRPVARPSFFSCVQETDSRKGMNKCQFVQCILVHLDLAKKGC